MKISNLTVSLQACQRLTALGVPLSFAEQHTGLMQDGQVSLVVRNEGRESIIVTLHPSMSYQNALYIALDGLNP